MMNRSSRRLVLTGLCGLSFITRIPSSRAHGFHAAFSVVELNPRTGALEIIHRIFIQDMEALLTARAGAAVTLTDAPAMQKTVADYLRGVFDLKSSDGQTLTPEWVGLKLEVDTMFVYQEVKPPGELTALVVSDQILTETHPGQVNTVNITLKGRTQTVVFTAQDPPHTVAF